MKLAPKLMRDDINFQLGMILIEAIRLKQTTTELLNNLYIERDCYSIEATSSKQARNLSIDILIMDAYILGRAKVTYELFSGYCDVFDSYFYKKRLKA